MKERPLSGMPLELEEGARAMSPSSRKEQPERGNHREIPTSLEIPLIRAGGELRIDLTDLPIFFGLSILAGEIARKVIDRYHLDRVDIEVEKKIKRSDTPELAALQIENVKAVGDYGVFDRILTDPAAFYEEITHVFGTLQMQRWRRRLYPEDASKPSEALVFEFTRRLPAGEVPFRVILERLRSSKKAEKFFLRLTFEALDARHLDLSSFPHVVVHNPEGRTFIRGATRLSRMLSEQVRWQAIRGKRSYSEVTRADSDLFGRMADAGLGNLAAVEIGWGERYVEVLRSVHPDHLTGIFKKTLLLLEDHTVRRLLEAGETIRVRFGEMFAYLDLSQLGRSLNVSFGERRKVLSLERYLDRMPSLACTVSKMRRGAPLAGVHVVLIHHITAEVLGFIEGLRRLGVAKARTLFVHYGEDVPSDFLEALLSLDQTVFPCYCLDNVQVPRSVEGYFVLSRRFSSLDEVQKLNQTLCETRPGYFEAMVRTASYLFLLSLLEAARSGGKCLIVEDGGYLTPFLTSRALQGARLADLLEEWSLPVPEGLETLVRLPLSEVLNRLLIGTVEHTKNGMDRLGDLVQKFGGLVRPAFTIAVSDFKVNEEAREVASSILAALEAVLHSQGKVLSRRIPLVLGSEGAIGRNLVAQLRSRCGNGDPRSCLEVDLRVSVDGNRRYKEWAATRFDALPRNRLAQVDLILGVTGQPALRWEDAEFLLMNAERDCVYLVSGSTKTIEFEQVSRRLDELLKMRTPSVGGHPCRIESEDMIDPQTGRRLGRRYVFRFPEFPGQPGKEVVRELAFPGNLMPINFLYYGVPGEIMDPVLCQLLRTSVGLVKRSREGRPLENLLYAVDREIDQDGRDLRNPAARTERKASPC
jgi:hypothetical protein